MEKLKLCAATLWYALRCPVRIAKHCRRSRQLSKPRTAATDHIISWSRQARDPTTVVTVPRSRLLTRTAFKFLTQSPWRSAACAKVAVCPAAAYLHIRTYHITDVNALMYRRVLRLAGLHGADVTVAAPFGIPGVQALPAVTAAYHLAIGRTL